MRLVLLCFNPVRLYQPHFVFAFFVYVYLTWKGKRAFDSVGKRVFDSVGKRVFDSVGKRVFDSVWKRVFDSDGNVYMTQYGKVY